jgi:hypothetical protein
MRRRFPALLLASLALLLLAGGLNPAAVQAQEAPVRATLQQDDPACADVPPPVSGTIRPGTCVTLGTQLVISAVGFEAGEQVAFWITAPDDSVFGAEETLPADETGSLTNLPINSRLLDVGLWYIVFQGIESGHQAVIYFRLLSPGSSPESDSPPPSDEAPASCADVPAPVSGAIRPDRCVPLGTVLEIDVFGFAPNEEVGFWITAPDGSVFGSEETVNIGPQGAALGLPFDTSELTPGLWYWVFEGTESGHQAVIYFRLY